MWLILSMCVDCVIKSTRESQASMRNHMFTKSVFLAKKGVRNVKMALQILRQNIQKTNSDR